MTLISSIKSYWKLDESSGNASDSVGSVTLTNNNTITYSAGKVNNGANFVSASSQYFTTSSLTVTAAFSISLWVKITSTGTNNTLFSSTSVGSSTSIALSIRTDNKFSYSNFVNEVVSASTLSAGTWYHIVLTSDGTNSVLYLNGSSDATSSSVSHSSSTEVYELGRQATYGTNLLGGSLDEVGIWDRALTSGEVTSLYNSGLGSQYNFSPIVSTEAVTSIGVTTAVGNGTVVNDCGFVITERGIVWDIAPNPTVASDKATSAGTTGAFTASLTSLTAVTTYYVRAYAINEYGTSYGSEVTFATDLIPSTTIYKDINGVEGETYAVRMTVGGTTGSITVSLGSTGTSQVINAGAGVSTFQGTYGGLNGLTIVKSGSFDGYIDDVMYVLVLGDAAIDWSLDSLTNVYPINSSVLFKRLEDKDFDKFRIYRYLDIQFKDYNAYVTVLLKKEANEDASSDTKEFLIDNVSGETLPFINKRVSMLTKNYGMRIGLSNNRLNETFAVCQLVVSGMGQPKKLFSGDKIISI